MYYSVIYPHSKSDTDYTVPSETRFILTNAFLGNTSLENIVFGDDITTIQRYALTGCPNIKTVTLPASIVEIGYGAFYSSDLITDVYYSGTESYWNKVYIDGGNYALTNATIHYGDVDLPQLYIKNGSYDYNNGCFTTYDIYLKDVAPGKTVMLSYYDNDNLLYTERKVYGGEDYLVFDKNTNIKNADCIKAMVLEDILTLKPVCPSSTMYVMSE